MPRYLTYAVSLAAVAFQEQSRATVTKIVCPTEHKMPTTWPCTDHVCQTLVGSCVFSVVREVAGRRNKTMQGEQYGRLALDACWPNASIYSSVK